MPGGPTYYTAKDWIEKKYGTNGVPDTAILTVLRHFLPNITEVHKDSIPFGSLNNAYIHFYNPDSTGHAVNAVWRTDSTTIMTVDYQGNPSGTVGFVTPDSVVKMYK